MHPLMVTPRRFDLLQALLLVLVSMDLLFIGYFCAWQSLDIPIKHLDGAYQTASGLCRLAQGQMPGRDFYPYLGLGPIYFIYPLFLIAGKQIAAS
ncbi:MAG TPA: hypothetical protein PLV25_04345, partial [Opitutales bacterium]|nr:hypothetical protein [Opitutales bacterium]